MVVGSPYATCAILCKIVFYERSRRSAKSFMFAACYT